LFLFFSFKKIFSLKCLVCAVPAWYNCPILGGINVLEVWCTFAVPQVSVWLTSYCYHIFLSGGCMGSWCFCYWNGRGICIYNYIKDSPKNLDGFPSCLVSYSSYLWLFFSQLAASWYLQLKLSLVLIVQVVIHIQARDKI